MDKFEMPRMEIMHFDVMDIITTSGAFTDYEEDDDRPGHGWGDKNHNHQHWKDYVDPITGESRQP